MIFLVNTYPSKDSSSRFSMNHTPQLLIHAHVHFVIIQFTFLISCTSAFNHFSIHRGISHSPFFYICSLCLKIIIFIAYIHQNLVNVSNYKHNNFQEMLESFKHLNEKFHGEMRSGFLFLPSYKTWKDQISDIDAGCVNKTYHDLSITGICDEIDVPLGQNHVQKLWTSVHNSA